MLDGRKEQRGIEELQGFVDSKFASEDRGLGERQQVRKQPYDEAVKGLGWVVGGCEWEQLGVTRPQADIHGGVGVLRKTPRTKLNKTKKTQLSYLVVSFFNKKESVNYLIF